MTAATELSFKTKNQSETTLSLYTQNTSLSIKAYRNHNAEKL